jgi:hypothetical protein
MGVERIIELDGAVATRIHADTLTDSVAKCDSRNLQKILEPDEVFKPIRKVFVLD